MENLKNIHIGILIKKRVDELQIDISRICNFFKYSVSEITVMYNSEIISTDLLLKWCKLLEYDFFRLYSHHLILFSPPACNNLQNRISSELPQFRKKIYTKEIIDFILELINTGQKTKRQITQEYGIPKTTVHKWFQKYNN